MSPGLLGYYFSILLLTIDNPYLIEKNPRSPYLEVPLCRTCFHFPCEFEIAGLKFLSDFCRKISVFAPPMKFPIYASDTLCTRTQEIGRRFTITFVSLPDFLGSDTKHKSLTDMA